MAKSIAVWGKRSHTTALHCRALDAKCILDGQSHGIQQLLGQSFRESPLQYYITGHVFDETKLWYIIPGMGYRNFSTLAHHTQLTWKTALGKVHDADVIRTPKAMVGYSAAVQCNILTQDHTAGVLPQVGSRPLARFYGTLTMCDSHKVNHLSVKYVRSKMDECDLMLPGFCLQHHVGTAATSVCRYFKLFTRVCTLSKMLVEMCLFLQGSGLAYGCSLGR